MQGLSVQLRTQLTDLGASLVGFADLTNIPAEQRDGYDYGISISVAIDPAVINGIGNGPTQAYGDSYVSVNQRLDNLVLKAADIIKAHGFNAFPKNKANIHIDHEDLSTILPHKTVATRAGLGWIGKCAVLVTQQYGSAVRISSLLTDAPLDIADPINQSQCGNCDVCVRNCPTEALSGDLWSVDVSRETFYNAYACRKKCVESTWRTNPGETHCIFCVLVCPWTKKYIQASGINYNFPSVDVAARGDYEEILNLQKLAYQSEAAIYNDYSIPPLVQTLKELQAEAKDTIILKVVEDRKIIGSVRAFERDGTCYIGKLIVHPNYVNRGTGKKLMAAIEKCFPGLRYELLTGYRSEKNLALYEKLGYKRFKTEEITDNLQFVYLQKQE